MVCRLAFAIVFVWGIVGSADAAQVALDSKPWPKRSLRMKSVPADDRNALLDATLLGELTPLDSSGAKPGENPQLKNLLRLASGTERLDPAAFDSLFEQLRTDMRSALNNSMRGIEDTYNGYINDIAACATNLGFHPPNQLYHDYVAAEEAFGHAYNDSEQKCSAKTTQCDDRHTKGMSLHNYVQNDIVDAYHSAPTPTHFGLSDFYLREIDDVAAILKQKHAAWETAAGLCDSAEGACEEILQDVDHECGEVNGAAVNGRNEYNECYNEKQGVLEGYDEQGQVENQKTLVRNLEKVLCIVKVAVDSHGDSPKTDGSVTCDPLPTTVPGLLEFKCVCVSLSSPVPPKYSETYVAQHTLMEEPDRHTAWDPLGCANRDISTTLAPAVGAPTTTPSDPDAAHLVAEFNVGQPPIVLPHTPALLFAPQSGFFGFDQAQVMWKIEWKCRFAEVPPSETVIMNLRPGGRKIWAVDNPPTVKSEGMGSVYIRTNWTPDTSPHVYVLEWSAAAGSSMSVDGVVMDSNPNLKLEMGTGTWSTGLNLGHGPNLDMKGEWYYTKVYIA